MQLNLVSGSSEWLTFGNVGGEVPVLFTYDSNYMCNILDCLHKDRRSRPSFGEIASRLISNDKIEGKSIFSVVTFQKTFLINAHRLHEHEEQGTCI